MLQGFKTMLKCLTSFLNGLKDFKIKSFSHFPADYQRFTNIG